MGKLGYSSITLTDLTETLPMSLTLETNLQQNLQTKNGENYSPDFSSFENGVWVEELIITPSLFLGNEEVEVPVAKNELGEGFIYYQIKGLTEEINYFYDEEISEDSEIYVDSLGKLHFRKNLLNNITIEAYIDNYKNSVHNFFISSIKTINPITILLLEDSLEKYLVEISSDSGRDFFDEINSSPIELTASLFLGAQEINEVTYEWYTIESDGSKTIFSEEKTITITRSQVFSTALFFCQITLVSSGELYTASKALRDFTDGYSSQIISDGSLILTPDNPTLLLVNQIWYQTQIINDINSERFTYKWVLLKSDGTSEILTQGIGQNYQQCTINKEQLGLGLEEENFTVLCSTIIDNKVTVLQYIDLRYQLISYSSKVFPNILFAPANTDGTPSATGSFFTQTIVFQLLDENKQPLSYNSSESRAPELFWGQEENIDLSNFSVSQNGDFWDFEITFSLDLTENNNLWLLNSSGEEINSSKTYSFSYTYLNETFLESFEVIKNYAGESGRQPSSGYTILFSNDFHCFAGESTNIKDNETTTSIIQAYYGNDPLEILEIKVDDEVLLEKETTFSLEKDNLLITANRGLNQAIEVSFSALSNSNQSASNNSIFFYIKIKHEEEVKVFLKIFEYIINYNDFSYYLLPSHNAINFIETGKSYLPSSLTVSALYEEIQGQPSIYSGGKIIYSLDGENWENYSSNISGYENLKNIYLRLYEANSTVDQNPNNLDENENYLLDKQIIPILSSGEKYKIGGENLIKWSKFMPLENGKWQSNNSSIIKEEDFSYGKLYFNPDLNTISELISPKIKIASQYFNQVMCLSYFLNLNNDEGSIINWEQLISEKEGAAFEAYLLGFKEYGEEYSFCAKIGEENSFEKESYSSENDWLRFYKVFLFNSEAFEDITSINNCLLEECKYFSIKFAVKGVQEEGETFYFGVKKTKLELGNIPSDWSASPYDLDFSDVSGANLLSYSNSYKIEVKGAEEYKEILIEVPDLGNYTFSWSNAEDGSLEELFDSFLIEIYGILQGSSSLKYSGIFPLHESGFFTVPIDFYSGVIRIYAGFEKTNINPLAHLIITYLKVEAGNTATPYLLNGQQVTEITTSIANQALALGNDIENLEVVIETTRGQLTSSLNEINNQIDILSTSKVNINDLEGEIELVTNNFLNGKVNNSLYDSSSLFFTQIQKAIKIDSSADQPYIQIMTAIGDQTQITSSENFYTKITSSKLSFYQNNKEVAYISNDALQINRANFLNSFTIGNEISGLLQVSVTDNGVGFVWG